MLAVAAAYPSLARHWLHAVVNDEKWTPAARESESLIQFSGSFSIQHGEWGELNAELVQMEQTSLPRSSRRSFESGLPKSDDILSEGSSDPVNVDLTLSIWFSRNQQAARSGKEALPSEESSWISPEKRRWVPLLPASDRL